MTDSYVFTRTKEALAATNGDRRDAQKLLVTWAVRDQALLLGLTKSHLKAIVAAQVDHAARVINAGKSDEEEDIRLSRSEIDKIIADKSQADKRSYRGAVPAPKTSANQESVMHYLAETFRKQKDKAKE